MGLLQGDLVDFQLFREDERDQFDVHVERLRGDERRLAEGRIVVNCNLFAPTVPDRIDRLRLPTVT